MQKPENNFNAVNHSTRIITPGDAKIVEETNFFLNADNPKAVLSSLELIFNAFLMSESSEDLEIRTNCLYHYNLMRDFVKNLIINQNKTA